jgi:hypothetical protein
LPEVRNRLALLGLALAVLGVACGPSAADEPRPTTTTHPGATISEPGSTSDSVPVTSTSLPDVTSTSPERPVAPDFTLQLGEGGSYTLSDGEKPVYLVFWAEW